MCEYCEGIIPISFLNSNGRPKIIKEDGIYYIDSYCSKFKIRYCPMCGKKLVMEVQDDTE